MKRATCGLKFGPVGLIGIFVCLVMFVPVTEAAVATEPGDGDAWTQSVTFSDGTSAGGAWEVHDWSGTDTRAAVEASDIAKVGTKSIFLNSVGETQVAVRLNPPVDVSSYDCLKVWFKTSDDWPESVESFRLQDENSVHYAQTKNVYIYHPSTGHDWHEIVIPKSQWTDDDFDGTVLQLIQFGASNRLPAGKLYIDGLRFERIGASAKNGDGGNVPEGAKGDVTQLIGEKQSGKPGECWRFASSELEMIVGKDTGLLCGLRSLKPTPLEIVPFQRGGLAICIKNRDEKWSDFASVLKESSVSEGTKGDEKYTRLSCLVDFSEVSHRSIAEAEVVYTLYEGYLNTRVTIKCHKTDKSLFEIGVAQLFHPGDWSKQFYYTWNWWETHSPTSTVGRIMYCPPEIDAGKSPENARYAPLPIGVLERKDRKLLWGYLDLGSSTILTPNCPDGYLPSFSMDFKGIAKGDSYSFDFFCKVFPQPGDNYRDIFRWYQHNWYSTSPLTKDIIRSEDDKPRSFLQGNTCGTRYGTNWDWVSDPETGRRLEEGLLKVRATNLCMTGPWYPNHPYYPPFTLDGQAKKYIEKLHSKGFKVLLYFNQYLNVTSDRWTEETIAAEKRAFSPEQWAAHEKRWEIYKRWAAKFPGGSFYGDTSSGYLNIDFCNEDVLAWYVKGVKDCIEFYDADGIFWDTSWALGYSFSPSHPESSTYHGMHKIQCELYKWIRENHPEKKVLANGAIGTPTQLCVDAVLIEKGARDVVPDDLDWEVLKCFNTSILCSLNSSNYRDRYKGSDGKVDGKSLGRDYVKNVMLGLALGGSWGDYAANIIQVPEACYSQDSSIYYNDVLQKIPDLLSFAGKTSGIPLVVDGGVLLTQPTGLERVGSVWADSGNLLVALVNNTEDNLPVCIKLDEKILGEYGQSLEGCFYASVFGPDGLLKPHPTVINSVSRGGAIEEVRATLGLNELLVMEKVPLAISHTGEKPIEVTLRRNEPEDKEWSIKNPVSGRKYTVRTGKEAVDIKYLEDEMVVVGKEWGKFIMEVN